MFNNESLISIIPNNKYQSFIFDFFDYFLKQTIFPTWFEIQLIIVQFIQVLSFIYNPIIQTEILQTPFIKGLYDLIESFRIVSLFKGGSIFYLIFFYVCVIYVLLYFLITISGMILLNKPTFQYSKVILSIADGMIRINTSVLFLPLINGLMSVFNCDDKAKNYYAPSLQCYDSIYYINSVLSGLMIVSMIIITWLVIVYGYDIKYNKKSFSAKRSSWSRLMFFLEQIIFVFFREIIRSNDITILCYLLISLYIGIDMIIDNPYYCSSAKKAHLIFHLLILWGVISLALDHFLIKTLGFYSIILFFFGTPIIVLPCYLYVENTLDSLISHDKHQNDYLLTLLILANKIDTYDHKRNDELLLKSFIALRNITINQENGVHDAKDNELQYDYINLLLLMETLFKEGLSKYTPFTLLRICYADFLIFKLKQKNRAIRELSRLDYNSLSSYETFLIHRIMKEINPYAVYNELIDDVKNDIIYTKHLHHFKELITEVSRKYLSFWTLLSITHPKSNSNILQLNNIGYSIYTTCKTINELFGHLQLINPNDRIAMKYYADFLIYFMDDPVKADPLLKRVVSIENDMKICESDEIINIDINLLTQTDSIYYIIISIDPRNNSQIKEISLAICEYLSYTPSELINNSLDVIIPDMMKVEHHKVLLERYHNFRERSIKSNISKFQYKTFTAFALNKSKFLLPLRLNSCIMPNEYDDHFFIAKVIIERNEHSLIGNQCSVLTDTENVIQNFSQSASTMLNLNSYDMHQRNLSTYINVLPGKSMGIGSSFKGLNIMNKESNEEYCIQWKKKDYGNINVNTENKQSSSIVSLSVNNSGVLSSNNNMLFTMTKNPLVINGNKVGIVYKFYRKLIRNKESNKSKVVNQLLDSEFIPQNDDHFQYNYQTQEYTFGNDEAYDHIEELKTKALQNIKTIVSSQSNTDGSSSYYDSSSSSSSSHIPNGSYASSSHSMIKKDTKPTPHNISRNNYHIITIPNHSKDYYHVNTLPIEYSIYNYNTLHFDIISKRNKDNQKLNQVDQVINDYMIKIKENEEMSSKEKEANSNKYLQYELNEKRSIQKTHLSYSLLKQERHPEIIRLRIVSLFITLIVLSEGLSCYMFYHEKITRIAANIHVISVSYDLFLDSIICTYLVRELSLIKNDNYTIMNFNMSQYRNEIIDDLKEYFFRSEVLFDDLLKSPIPYSDINKNILFTWKMNTYMIRDDLGLLAYNLSICEGLMTTMTSLSQITVLSSEEFLPSLDNVYFYAVNGLNGVYLILKEQAKILIKELNHYIGTVSVSSMYYVGSFIVLNIFCYLVITGIFFKVANKKNEYLGIFFEIEDESIERLLKLCEAYSAKYEIRNLNLQLSSNAIDADEDNEGNGKEQLDLCSQMNDGSKGNKKKPPIKAGIYCQCNEESVTMRLFFLTYLGLIIILFLIMILHAKSSFLALEYSIQILQGNILFEGHCLVLFNIFREFLFDSSINIFYRPIQSSITSNFATIYELLNEENKRLQNYTRYTSQDYQLTNEKMKKTDVCSFSTIPSSIPSKYSCEKVTNGAAANGIDVLFIFYIEEIKRMIYDFQFVSIIFKEKDFKYNETLLGLPQYNQLYPHNRSESDRSLYEMMHPVNFFNSDEHNSLVIIFRYILLPIITAKKKSLIDGVEKDKVSFKIVFEMMILAYWIIIVFAYLVIWLRLERKLNDIIYKAKNILGIVPMDVLIQLESIGKMFGLKLNDDII